MEKCDSIWNFFCFCIQFIILSKTGYHYGDISKTTAVTAPVKMWSKKTLRTCFPRYLSCIEGITRRV